MPEIYPSVACNLETDILSACYPLFEEERVAGIEWSFDVLYQQKEIPLWFYELLQLYSQENRLIGHGVFFSLFSGRWLKAQQEWLDHLKNISQRFRFNHITEHFGFLTGRDFHSGAPLNIPYSSTTLQIGRDRLKRIYDACRCPVGLENLAFSYSADEVKKHGEFLEELIEPINGFIILDLHNLYCQSHNFSIPPDILLSCYPLHRVREIHISGGSWDNSFHDSSRIIRRDTHDDAVPGEVFELLKLFHQRCPNLKFVVMEQLGTALKTEESRRQFYNDFLTMQTIVEEMNSTDVVVSNNFLPPETVIINGIPVADEQLYQQQMELSDVLETASDFKDLQQKLLASSLLSSEWNIEQWDPCMVETAMKIAQKWKNTSDASQA